MEENLIKKEQQQKKTKMIKNNWKQIEIPTGYIRKNATQPTNH